MHQIRVAFATDDHVSFMDRHFGDAKYFEIYDITDAGASFVKRIVNTVEDEDETVHADPVKAGGIMGLLSLEGVNTAASKVFGPNIMRIRKRFVCVMMNDASIADAARRLAANRAAVEAEWQKGEARAHLNMNLSP
ncbi:MAG: hypothetical protein JXM71_03395 [Spirochaetales bacterium]|nr:hypothetical protein [Spirochaetales bacterium]